MSEAGYEKALAYLNLYTNYERELRYPYDGWSMNIERVRLLLDELGAPDKSLSVVHIAGTKGKGSTAVMIEAAARAAGYKTGLFTSPHLLEYRERIRIDYQPVEKAAVAAWVERLMPAAEKVHSRPKLGKLTYFEILTALALAVFAEARVDLAVLETGLGGRFDATNVCDPLASVLTPVSLDHTDILGDTLEEIASEKAMIIKPGKPAVIAPQTRGVYAVFASRAREVGAEQIRVADVYSWKTIEESATGQKIRLAGRRVIEDLFIPLPGEPQAINAAVAAATLDVLEDKGFSISDGRIKKGMASISWPARFQRVSRDPDVILDGAHNASSAGYLRDTLSRLYGGKKIIAVLGLGGDKDVEGFCRELGPALDRAVITKSRAMKAVPAGAISSYLAEFGVECKATDAVAAAMEEALAQACPDSIIVVTGSFYVISEAMEWFAQKV